MPVRYRSQSSTIAFLYAREPPPQKETSRLMLTTVNGSLMAWILEPHSSCRSMSASKKVRSWSSDTYLMTQVRLYRHRYSKWPSQCGARCIGRTCNLWTVRERCLYPNRSAAKRKQKPNTLWEASLYLARYSYLQCWIKSAEVIHECSAHDAGS